MGTPILYMGESEVNWEIILRHCAEQTASANPTVTWTLSKGNQLIPYYEVVTLSRSMAQLQLQKCTMAQIRLPDRQWHSVCNPHSSNLQSPSDELYHKQVYTLYRWNGWARNRRTPALYCWWVMYLEQFWDSSLLAIDELYTASLRKK